MFYDVFCTAGVADESVEGWLALMRPRILKNMQSIAECS